jgi:hypothetical protein
VEKNKIDVLSSNGAISRSRREDAPISDRGGPGIELDLSAFDRIGPNADRIRLCLDFGTAMSKAWATGRGSAETLPLLIGKAAGGEALYHPQFISATAEGSTWARIRNASIALKRGPGAHVSTI